MVALRDGRKLIGVLRSWDQFGAYIEMDIATSVMAPPHRTYGINVISFSLANLVLQSTVERIFVHPAPQKPGEESGPPARGLYADIPRGIFIVRGENVLLLGEIDLDKDDDPPPGYDQAEVEQVQALAKERKAAEKAKDKSRIKTLSTLGFEGENMGEILL
jgi:U6 snRNA-associated Sm-like protein LSm1